MASDLPAGTVTLVFTDIEGSTRLLAELGDGYAAVLAEHRRILREAVRAEGGAEVDYQGDGCFFVFSGARPALASMAAAQRNLAALPVRVRTGIHTGEPQRTAEGYVGLDVHRAARICAAASGGQTLVSDRTAGLAGMNGLRDLGVVRLKDLSAPQRVYQVGDEMFPPVRALRQTNLPVFSSSLVGRKHELEQLLGLISHERLVTVLGPGGSGKTRLALQVAADAADVFPDGVWWVPLAAVRDPGLVRESIARAVGSGEDLDAFLRGRCMLVLIDNVEQVLGCGVDLAALLGAAPRIQLLVTSREPLRLIGERRYPLPPMAKADAQALFLARGQAVDPGLVPDATVAAICERLDRLPLGIELAAARVSLLPPAQLLDRLDNTLGLLTEGPRDAPERQRTMRATIDWSHELLAGDDRTAFRRLSVFRGSFTLEASERACGVSLEPLASLVEKNLVRRLGDGRLLMLELIRLYAAEQLRAAGEEEAFQQRHLAYFLSRTEATPLLDRETGEGLAEQLLLELDNLRAALEHAYSVSPESALRLGAGLVDLWLRNEVYADARGWLERAPFEDTAIPPGVRLAARQAGARLAFHVGEQLDLAELHFTEGLALAKELDDQPMTARLLLNSAGVAATRGDQETCIRRLESALEISRAIGNPKIERNCLHLLGEALRDQQRLPEARGVLADSLRLSRALDDGFAPNTEHSVADLDLDAGHYVEAAHRYADVIANELGSRRQNRRLELYCVAGIAAALAALDNGGDALHLWSCVERREQASGLRLLQIERSRYEVWMDRARSVASIDKATEFEQIATETPWDDAVRAAIAHARELSS